MESQTSPGILYSLPSIIRHFRLLEPLQTQPLVAPATVRFGLAAIGGRGDRETVRGRGARHSSHGLHEAATTQVDFFIEHATLPRNKRNDT
jgi:hypothetical protein